MVKLASQRKLKWCLVHFKAGELTSNWTAKYRGVSQRRFQQIYKEYQTTGKIPSIGLNVGRPKKEVPQQWKSLIKEQYEKTHCGALYLEKKLITKHGVHISHNIIHQVLLELVTLITKYQSRGEENLGYTMSELIRCL
jgi:putative transposase